MQKSLKGIVLVIMMIQFVCSNLFAQTTPPPTGPTGKISGKVIDQANGETVISAVVKAKNNSTGFIKGASTDIDGKFVLKLPVGNYSLTISYPGYEKDSLPSIDVIEGQVYELNRTIQERVMTTNTVVITGQIEKDNNSFILLERKNSAQVSDGISSESFKKTPDRTTADVLKRVTGASIQDGKFAIIRGMNDRYNAGYLNDAPLPSTEADRKAFSFDVIPANLIDNLQIMKAGTPDISGDFAGGVIQIRTKAIPTSLTQSLNIGGQFNSLATFKESTTFKRYSSDKWGVIPTDRKLPSDLPTLASSESGFPTTKEIDEILLPTTKKFKHDFSREKFNTLPNLRFSYAIGFPTKIAGKDFGVIAAVTYSNTRSFSASTINVFRPDNENGLDKEYKDSVFKQNVSAGAILNLSCKLATNHTIGLRNFYNVNADNTSLFRNGTINKIDIPWKTFAMSNLMNFSNLLSNQLYGEHGIGANPFIIKWYVNNSIITRQTPDYKIVNYTVFPADPANDKFEQSYEFTNDNFKQGSGRFFSNMNERLTNGEVNVKKSVKITAIKTDIKAGFFMQNRAREFFSRTFVYNKDASFVSAGNPDKDINDANFNQTGLYLNEKTGQTDKYDATSNLLATYLMLDNKFTRLRAVYGVRFEKFSQLVIGKDYAGEERIRSNFKTQNIFLPSLNLSYSLTEKSNLRTAYYRTVNRPEFRELASFGFYRFDVDADQVGSPTLQSAKINNIDVRYELFPTASQVVSVGGFVKLVTNPIENNVDVTQSTKQFFYSNEKSATILGAEIEFRKTLNFIADKYIFRNTTVYANLALIQSKVQFNSPDIAIDRPLQGQSPYIINGGITFDDSDKGWGASIAVNRSGKRIAFVGDNRAISRYADDVYEMPRTVIDAQVSKSFGKFNLKATFGDLLAQDLVFIQKGDAKGNGSTATKEYTNELFRYTMPWTFTLAAGIQF